jgi:hypothetical protein
MAGINGKQGKHHHSLILKTAGINGKPDKNQQVLQEPSHQELGQNMKQHPEKP